MNSMFKYGRRFESKWYLEGCWYTEYSLINTCLYSEISVVLHNNHYQIIFCENSIQDMGMVLTKIEETMIENTSHILNHHIRKYTEL